MRIALHILGYDCTEYIFRCLQPWWEARQQGLDLVISIGHVCFKEFQEMGFPIESKDGSHQLFQDLFTKRKIDYYQFLEKPLVEYEARNEVLRPLLTKYPDWLVISAPDEIFTTEEIFRLDSYVKKNSLTAWFRIRYRNLIFSEQTFVDDFAPPRVFNNVKYKIGGFFADDEILFDANGLKGVNYLNLSSQTVPKTICNPLHYTWLDNDRSRNKVTYQTNRWGKNGCGFCIEDGKLAFNKAYYKARGMEPPELFNI